MRLVDPLYLILFAILPAMLLLYLRGRTRKPGTIRFSDIGILGRIKPTRSIHARHMLIVLRLVGAGLIIFALARPQSVLVNEEITTEGIDIILALDRSGSMRAEDFKPNNRLTVAKQVIENFIRGRTNDLIGLVVFSGRSYTQCPLTLDYGVLADLLRGVEITTTDDGTAIGMALANCVNRLRKSKAESKVVVLLTDGANNTGKIDPITAAKLAEAMGIRIYTVGAGTQGKAPYPVEDPIFGKRYVWVQSDVDEGMLQEIATITGGRFYRATDEQALADIYDEIDDLEKTEIETKQYTKYTEVFHLFIIAALSLLLLEIILANTRFRKIP